MKTQEYKFEDLDFEIKFYEGILKQKPDFQEALILLGDIYTKKGLYAQGLAIDLKICQLRPDDPIAFYNLSCSYSLLNQIDQACEAMQKAIGLGYDQFAYLENDADLKNLLQHDAFRQYLSQEKSKRMISGKSPSL